MTPAVPFDLRDPPYAPHRPTALVLTGSGTAGAYHAGVLRALEEAGVKIDLVAGCGMGVVSALCAAIDGSARLWESGGLWRHSGVGRLYGARPALSIAALALAAALLGVLVPGLALVVAAAVYPLAFFLGLLGIELGHSVAAWQARFLEIVFAQNALVLVPRYVVVCLVVLWVTLFVSAIAHRLRSSEKRRSHGAIWWRLLGAPLDVRKTRAWFVQGLWEFIKGAAPIARPSDAELGRRYAELLAENLGQPRFREIILTAHDLDARCDLVFALLAESSRRRFFQRQAERGSRIGLEILDLAGAAREHALDAAGGALSLPVATEPHIIAFAPDSAWRGERHRLCARPDAVGRLVDEVAAAGAEQIILVTPTAETAGPHALGSGRRDLRGRAGEYLAGIEAAALRDAVTPRASARAFFVIRPAHNPLGPLDFSGAYDERSDRHQTLAELIDRGYEDAYRQFVDPVVGASGEKIEPAQQKGV